MPGSEIVGDRILLGIFISLTILLYHILPTKSIEDFYQLYQILPRSCMIMQISILFSSLLLRQPRTKCEGFISVADDNGIVPILYRSNKDLNLLF